MTSTLQGGGDVRYSVIAYYDAISIRYTLHKNVLWFVKLQPCRRYLSDTKKTVFNAVQNSVGNKLYNTTIKQTSTIL